MGVSKRLLPQANGVSLYRCTHCIKMTSKSKGSRCVHMTSGKRHVNELDERAKAFLSSIESTLCGKLYVGTGAQLGITHKFKVGNCPLKNCR